MAWNYRVVRHEYEAGGRTNIRFAVHEAFYDDDGTVGLVTGVPVEVVGSNIEFEPGDPVRELRKDVAMMLLAFDKPVLNWEDYDDEPCEYWRK